VTPKVQIGDIRKHWLMRVIAEIMSEDSETIHDFGREWAPESFPFRELTFALLWVASGKADIESRMDIRDAGDVEEGHMETVGFVGVVERDDIWESLPHLLTKGVGPNEGNNTTLKLADAVLDPGVGEVLEEGLGRGISTEGLGLRFVHLVLDISSCPDLES
jgi:hypothetical protein